ncbi:protein kinase domain-containing protein [Nocardia tengchongensis]|uniref:serine/threonine-protein kinase n=1 Tax=Nocardia tengchongensis TaxID=2055889 RepID=UPI00360CDEA2
MRLDPGAEFAGFTIERTLGNGGMGIVYLARNPQLNRLVALKVLGELIAADTRGRARFEREAALAARLEHPNIVTIYDRAPSDAAVPWICMKYVGGGDVAQRMSERGGPLPDDQAVGILTDAARALDHAHRHGILHRDVKPGNILLDHTAGDLAVLTDFGIARALDDTLTLTGTAATFAYAAPERFHGATADHRADIYSLGCTFYELLTARQPFPRTDQAAVIAAHLNTPPPRVTDLRPDLPAGLDDVIAIALAKNPDDRYPTCTALAEAATRILTRSHPGNPRTAPTLPASPHNELIATLPAATDSRPSPAPHLTPPHRNESRSGRTDSADPHLPIAQASPTDPAVAGRDEPRRSRGRQDAPDATDTAALPESIRVGLDSPHPEIRRGAVRALSTHLSSRDDSQVAAARKALHHIATHDSPAVASYAREILGGAATMDSPRLPGDRRERGTHLRAGTSAEAAGSPAAQRASATESPSSAALSDRVPDSGRQPGSPDNVDPPGGGRAPLIGGRPLSRTGVADVAGTDERPEHVGQDRALAGWRGRLAGVLTVLSGASAVVAGGILLDSSHMPFADFNWYTIDYLRIDDLLARGSWYFTAVIWISAAVGLLTFLTIPRRATRQALLAGFSLTGLWGAVVLARLEGWVTRHHPGFHASTGAHFALNAHLFLCLAGLLAAAALLLSAPRFEFRRPSGRFAITTAALGAVGGVLLGSVVLASILDPAITRPDFLWQFASAAVLALTPAVASALHPRRRANLLVIGCAAGESAISVALIGQAAKAGDAAAERWVLVPPVLFSITVLAIGVVTVIEALRIPDHRSA